MIISIKSIITINNYYNYYHYITSIISDQQRLWTWPWREPAKALVSSPPEMRKRKRFINRQRRQHLAKEAVILTYIYIDIDIDIDI
jgi:hypothetical protein